MQIVPAEEKAIFFFFFYHWCQDMEMLFWFQCHLCWQWWIRSLEEHVHGLFVEALASETSLEDVIDFTGSFNLHCLSFLALNMQTSSIILFSWRKESFGIHLMTEEGRMTSLILSNHFWILCCLKRKWTISSQKFSLVPTLWAAASVWKKWKHFFRSHQPGQEHDRVINWDLLLYLVHGFF